MGPRVRARGVIECRKKEIWNLRSAFAPSEIDLDYKKVDAVREYLNSIKLALQEVVLWETHDVESSDHLWNRPEDKESLASFYKVKRTDPRSSFRSLWF